MIGGEDPFPPKTGLMMIVMTVSVVVVRVGSGSGGHF
jgi:hypothetical protein